MRYFILIFVLAPIFLLGCTSTLKVRKVDSTQQCGPNDHTGVIYQLSKPKIQLKQNKISDQKASYTLELTSIPDAANRYSIEPDPAWLTDTKFKITLGNLGNITELNTSTKETFTPTVKAMGEFVGNLTGTLAKTILASGAISSTPPGNIEQIIQYVRAAGTDDEVKKYNITTQRYEPASDHEKNVWKNIVSYATEKDPDGKIILTGKNLYKIILEEDYVVHGDTYLLWRDTANQRMNDISTQKLTDCQQKSKNLSDLIKPILEKNASTNENQKSNLGSVKSKLDKFTNSEANKDLQKLADDITALLDPLVKELKPLQSSAEEWQTAWQNYLKCANENLSHKKLLDNVLGSEDKWLLVIEARISDLQRREIVNTISNDDRKKLDTLQNMRHFILGATPEWERVQVLRKFLKNEIVNTHIATTGYSKAREELENTLSAIKAKRDTVRPKETKIPDKESTIEPEIWVTDTSTTHESVQKQMDAKFGKDNPNQPEFVVVIEPAKGN